MSRAHWLMPPRGNDVRRLVAWITLAVAIPRLPFVPSSPVVYPLGILPQATFGWLCLVVGVALWATCGRWRLRARGRIVALLALLLWSVLAAATSSRTSLLIDIIIMYAMIGEIMAGHNEC